MYCNSYFLTLLLIPTLTKGIKTEVKEGVIGDEVILNCKLPPESDKCWFISPNQEKICSDTSDYNCETFPGLEVQLNDDECQLLISNLMSTMFGKWTCEVETWFSDIEEIQEFILKQHIDFVVEIVEYFGDVYFKKGDGLNVTCEITVFSDVPVNEHPGYFTWKLGKAFIINNSPYIATDENEWRQTLYYEPDMKDNNKVLQCYMDETDKDHGDEITLHMYEFKKENGGLEVSEEKDPIEVSAEFTAFPTPNNEDVFWEIDEETLVLDDYLENGIKSSELVSHGDNRYSTILRVPKKAVESQNVALNVKLLKTKSPFRIPGKLQKPAPPTPKTVEESIVVSDNLTVNDLMPKKSNGVKGLSIPALIVICGVLASIALCCFGFYIFRLCFSKKGGYLKANRTLAHENSIQDLKPRIFDEKSISKDCEDKQLLDNPRSQMNLNSFTSREIKDQSFPISSNPFSDFSNSSRVSKEGDKETQATEIITDTTLQYSPPYYSRENSPQYAYADQSFFDNSNDYILDEVHSVKSRGHELYSSKKSIRMSSLSRHPHLNSEKVEEKEVSSVLYDNTTCKRNSHYDNLHKYESFDAWCENNTDTLNSPDGGKERTHVEYSDNLYFQQVDQ